MAMERATHLCEESPMRILWSQEEEEHLLREAHRLTHYAVICRVIGARPNRGKLRDLLQGRLQDIIEKITNIQILGKGFYHLELESEVSATRPFDEPLRPIWGTSILHPL